jgi:transposase-like protein
VEGVTVLRFSWRLRDGQKSFERLADQDLGARLLKKERRHWSADEKIKLLCRHLIENVPISKICEEARLAPGLFHRWQEHPWAQGKTLRADSVVWRCIERSNSDARSYSTNSFAV